MRKRPGTRFLWEALPVVVDGRTYPSYLVKFEFSVGQTYILEFGHYEMRFGIDDHLIIDPATGNPYKIATPYSYQQAREMTYAQYKDTLFCTHWDLPIQKLVRGPSNTHTNWYWELVIVDNTDLVVAPSGVRLNQNGHNGVSYAVTAVKSGQESRGGYGAVAAYDPNRKNPTNAPTYSSDPYQLFANMDAWINQWRPQFGGVSGFPVISSSLRAQYNEPVVPDVPVPPATEWDNILASGQVTYMTQAVMDAVVALGYTQVSEYYHWVLPPYGQGIDGGEWYGYGETTGLLSSVSVMKPTNSVGLTALPTIYFWLLKKGATIKYIPLFGSYNGGVYGPTGRLRKNLTPFNYGAVYSAQIEVLNARYTPFSGVEAVDGSNSLLSEGDADLGPNAYTKILGNYIRAGKLGSLKGSTPLKLSQVKPLYDAAMKFIEDGTIRKNNIVAWNASTGATAYNIYRNTHADKNYRGFYLLAQVGASARTFEDTDVNTTTTNLAYSPAESGQFFDSPETYPHVCSFFQQRLVVGSTHASPLMLGGSRPGFFEDFLLSDNPLDTTGAWRFELMSKTSNPIEHIIPVRGLQVFTQAGAFASTSQGSLNASNVNFNQQAFNGASAVKPELVDRTVLFVPLNKQMVSASSYDYSADTFVDDNMLFTCQHLTAGVEITSLAYLRPTSSLVGCTLTDGRLLLCTFIPRQEFMGWVEATTAGAFLQVCSNTNAQGYDEFYFMVTRGSRYFIEKMEDTRPAHPIPDGGDLYLDSALSGYFENPVSEVTGLEHLEGLEVGSVADGSVQRLKTVVNGRIALDEPASTVHVGLPYEAEMETLDLEIQGMPTLRGAMRRIIRAIVEVEESSDLSWRLNNGKEWSAPMQRAAELASPPRPVTADIAIGGACDYVKGTRLRFRSQYPLPCQINSLVAEVQLG